MGSYEQAAKFYDLLYEQEKDYDAEAGFVAGLIREIHPGASTVLDVGCGTGRHARALIDRGLAVDGVDLEPAFVEIARGRCPEGSFTVADMTMLDLPGRYDAVTCLFSSIGYAVTERALHASIARMRAHLHDDGVLLVDPWFEPGQLTHGWTMALTGRSDEATVCRMSRTVVDGDVSRLEFEYMIGTAEGIERRSEVHELGLFTQAQMEAAFAAAGLVVERRPEALRTRGIYIGVARATA